VDDVWNSTCSRFETARSIIATVLWCLTSVTRARMPCSYTHSEGVIKRARAEHHHPAATRVHSRAEMSVCALVSGGRNTDFLIHRYWTNRLYVCTPLKRSFHKLCTTHHKLYNWCELLAGDKNHYRLFAAGDIKAHYFHATIVCFHWLGWELDLGG
jgi:hypothetical protein